MQYLDSNLEFLKERIKDIKIALFRSECYSELQLPNNIISTLQMDDDYATGVFFGLIAIFGGLGMLGAYFYERKNPPSDQQEGL